jgi:MGT family glycosyltransferase
MRRLTMKIGFLSMPLSGHLNSMIALARKLESRGNEVVFFGVPDVEPFVRAANLTFVPFCEDEYPPGAMAKVWGPVSKLHGEAAMLYSFRTANLGLLKAALDHLPQKLQESGVEAMVIDTIHSFVELVPMSMGMPFVHIWSILHIDFTGATPACSFSWPHETTPEALARNREGLKTLGSYFEPLVAVAKPYAEKMGLQLDWNDPTARLSKLAIITQTPREFDFPGTPWPAHFHYAGPFSDNDGRERVPFPWLKLTGKPLIYASLGTLVNGLEHIYAIILRAVGRLQDVQVVLSVGQNVDLENLGPIPSNTIVVRKAPQIELLKQAVLCITHAGLNTTLEALTQGVPMVAIPITYDQPGVAARIAYHGVGEFLEIKDLTVDDLFEMIQRVLTNSHYRDKAHYFRKVIARTKGLDVAADAIEEAFRKSQAAGLDEEGTVLSLA